MLNLKDEAALHRVLQRCAAEGIAHSASDISDGGLAVALAKACFAKGIGASILPASGTTAIKTLHDLFGETGSTVVLTCTLEDFDRIEKITEEEGGNIFAEHIGTTGGDALTIPFENGAIDLSIADLKGTWSDALESQLAAEVLA